MFSIGHSTRSADELIALLKAYDVRAVADVRFLPASRRHPHFNSAALEQRLSSEQIRYQHFRALGGLRRPRPDSQNSSWRHAGFRAYADHMETEGFRDALEALLSFATPQASAFMCAESLWWRCHRRLLADALTARGIVVRHILSEREAPVHELTSFARIVDGRVSYHTSQPQLARSAERRFRLF
jgi:uncharacterized protein (DUF488 family)